MFSDEQKRQLSAKLDAAHVKQRSQAGRSLSYIEGWFAIAEANRIFGFDGWQRETVEIRSVHEPHQNERGNWVVGYMAKSRITVGSLVREGCGFGSGIDRDLGRAHESALKECETDSMKRALMTFGNPFGLALYDKEQANVETNGHSRENGPPAARSESAETGTAKTTAAESAQNVAALEVLGLNGVVIARVQKASLWFSELREALREVNDPAALAAINEKTAAWLIEKHGANAKKDWDACVAIVNKRIAA